MNLQLTSLCLLLIFQKGAGQLLEPLAALTEDHPLHEDAFIEHLLPTLNLCCDQQLLESAGSCLSSPSTSVNKLLGPKKLHCEASQIETKTVTVQGQPESETQVYYDEAGTIQVAGITYIKSSYCVYKSNLLQNISILICSPGCNDPMSPCNRKCCEWDESLVRHKNGSTFCDSSHTNFTQLWTSKATEDSAGTFPVLPKFVNSQLYNLQDVCTIPRTLKRGFKVSGDGNILVQYGHESFAPVRSYCVEEATDYSETTSNLRVLYCHSDIVNYLWTPTVLQLIYCVISSVFIALSITVYYILRKQHTLMGWTQFSFLISAFLYYFFRSTRLSLELYQHFDTPIFIDTIDLFFTFGLLANILNLNAHLFMTFVMVKPEGQIIRFKDLKPVLTSVTIAWAFSFILILVELMVGAHSDKTLDTLMQFRIGVFVFLLVVTLLLAFGSGVVLFVRLRNSSSISSNGGLTSTQMLHLFSRLFCVTGSIWTLKILERLVKKEDLGRGWFWDVVQFLTYINGVVLFIVFVCNRKTLDGLRKRYPEKLTLLEMKKDKDNETSHATRTSDLK